MHISFYIPAPFVWFVAGGLTTFILILVLFWPRGKQK